jgi:hypothetical protein
MRIDNIAVCKPINELVTFFSKNGFVILERKVNDYHFHEVFIKMKNNTSVDLEQINFENIIHPKPMVFCCICHWSCVEIA